MALRDWITDQKPRIEGSPTSVADVATVTSEISGNQKNSIAVDSEYVASVATVASPEPKSEFVPVGDVLLMYERAAARLIELGKSRAEAEIGALPIVRAELHNDPRLAPDQRDQHHCLICGGSGTAGDILLPFLSAVPGNHHWMHSGCSDEHRRRQGEKAESCLRAAGLLNARAA